VGFIDEKAYAETVAHTRDFLNGRSEVLLQELTAKMEAAAEARAYEQAALLRDQLVQLRKITEKQHMVAGEADADVLAVATAYGEACVQVLFYRDGHSVSSQAFFPRLPEETPEAEVLAAFITQFYHERNAPPQLVISHALEGGETIAAWLGEKSGRKVSLNAKPREARRKWLELAEENARLSLGLRLSGKLTMQQRFAALAEAFAWPDVPERLECIDISHTQGEATLASCVVYDDYAMQPSQYRRYNITTAKAGDDYAAMREVLTRRYGKMQQARENGETVRFPDAVLIDGGKGQIRMATEVWAELGLHIPLVGIAKGVERKAGLEELILPFQNRQFRLPPNSPALHLLQTVRDESHRFAITGMRAKRDKARVTSSLNDIAGIGAKRKAALLTRFGGLRGVQAAKLDGSLSDGLHGLSFLGNGLNNESADDTRGRRSLPVKSNTACAAANTANILPKCTATNPPPGRKICAEQTDCACW